MRAVLNIVIVAVLLCGCGTRKPPPPPQRVTARIIGFGVFRTKLSSAHPTNSIDQRDLRVLVQTNFVTAGEGAQFGFVFEVNGLPAGGKVTLTQMIRRPVRVLYQLREDTVASTLPPFVASGNADRGAVTCELGRADQTVPGVYRVELWYRGHMLTGKAFIVVEPRKPKPKKQINRVAALALQEET